MKRGWLLWMVLVLGACSSGGPGPLAGTWIMDGPVPMTVVYRQGEEEAMGIISKVSYARDGQDVLVTYLDGMAKGNTIRISLTGPNSARTGFGTLRRIN